jgi:hypothetical protein
MYPVENPGPDDAAELSFEREPLRPLLRRPVYGPFSTPDSKVKEPPTGGLCTKDQNGIRVTFSLRQTLFKHNGLLWQSGICPVEPEMFNVFHHASHDDPALR